MTAKLLSGKETAKIYADRLADIVARLKAERGIVPKLQVILVGEDPASLIYDRAKMKKAREIGIDSELLRLPASTSEAKLLRLIGKFNVDRATNGILVQLPLPEHIAEARVTAAIAPEKDVDGFHPMNRGMLAAGNESGMMPCTPLGIVRLLERYKVKIAGRRAVVVGRSNIVGRPMSVLLLNRDATVAVCHSKTRNMAAVTREADILVSAAGRKNLIRAGHVKKGAAVVDVAMVRGKGGGLCGDTAFAEVAEKAKFITPVPGGVGPMTIIMLMENTVKAFLKQNKIDLDIDSING
ncbi:MAG: bifunctional methylenetetrahydrofolate dehydrogenase/methenyltetrahydrofolate cyclohydrolase [Rickettsiales bacterium]|jgi:methylenetetrahydrofolate dehydrogenase (NADP+)/methenyltetrahydrofolate cyclohydrolase|nr:bifunctional methylenetetrahydrofolate dehydrogenase/methenyltetrahydrofolate cyclohydrolase [Rickettsiales bacterium]